MATLELSGEEQEAGGLMPFMELVRTEKTEFTRGTIPQTFRVTAFLDAAAAAEIRREQLAQEARAEAELAEKPHLIPDFRARRIQAVAAVEGAADLTTTPEATAALAWYLSAGAIPTVKKG